MKLFAFIVSLLFAAASVFSQEPLYEVGASYYYQEEAAVDLSDLRGWASVAGIELPLPGKMVTSAVAEAGYTTATVWSLWSSNETEVKNVIAGAHFQIARGGPARGHGFDFDMRLVAGYRFTKNLAFRMAFLEDQTPVMVSLGWRF